MKSLLEKIGKEKSKNENLETRQENEIRNPSTENLAIVSKEEPGNLAAAAPCPVCGAVLHWLDRYGGGPHCHRCRDWPSYAVVARIVAADNSRWLTLWPLGDSEGSECRRNDQNASCTHRRSRRRVVWPVADRGNLLVADLDRVAEVEEFAECSGCGIWFLVSEFQEMQKGI